jgi:hypothetical protein
MNKKLWQTFPILPLALMGIMAVTRFSHFGSSFSLPDASLAVFFLAGSASLGLGFFALFLFEAGIIDYLAITQFSVSDFCISPAYACLIPTYAVMWFAGAYSKSFNALQFTDSLKTFGFAVFATTTAFIISNGSFYWLSGSFGELSWESYFRQSGHYLPSYVSASLIYIVAGLVVINLKKAIKTLATVES